MAVAVVDLEVTGFHRHVSHQHVERRKIDRRGIDEQIAVLDPGFVVMPGRQVARHRNPNAMRELTVQVQVRDGVVEAVADLNELILIDIVHDLWRGGVRMIERLELLREGGAKGELRPLEWHRVLFGRLEHVDAALIDRTNVLNRNGLLRNGHGRKRAESDCQTEASGRTDEVSHRGLLSVGSVGGTQSVCSCFRLHIGYGSRTIATVRQRVEVRVGEIRTRREG